MPYVLRILRRNWSSVGCGPCIFSPSTSRMSKSLGKLASIDAAFDAGWRQRANCCGGLAPASGRPRRLTARDLRRQRRLLMNGTIAAALPTDLWSCPRVACLIERELDVYYRPVHVSRLLHRLGFSPQKSTRRAIERDEERARAWIEKDWPQGKNAPRLRAAILVLDDSRMLIAPLVRRT